MLVGVCGKAGSGKDTIADYLVEKKGFKKIALADPIKRLVKDVFVLDDKTMYDRVEREKPLEQWGNWSVRKLLQVIGTEMFRRHISEDIWVRSLWYRVKEDPTSNYIISDVRFPNELSFLKEAGKEDFLSMKVVRDGYNGQVGVIGHESEKYDLETDILIHNNGSFSELYGRIDEIIASRIKK